MRIIGNSIDYDEISIRKYPLARLTRNKNKRIFGLDTETLHGNCRLIADNMEYYRFTDDINECLDFLSQKRFRSSHNFFFNLNYDINAIIKYLPKDNLTELYQKAKTHYDGYKLFFIPRKLFRLIHAKHSYKFYDVAQFFDSSLEKASLKYLGLDKYVEPIDRVELGTNPAYWKKHKASIIKYCINDSKLTQKLGVLLHDTVTTNIDLYPNSYISKASICKEFVRKSCKVPNVLDLPPNALRYAFNSYSGGRFEVLRKGKIGNATLYDINSAYPHTIRNLIDVTQGKWKRIKNLHERADYGYYLVKVLTRYNKISPIAIPLKNRVICYPLIECATYMTKNEILNYEPLIEYEVIDGWEFYADKYIYPFRNYIDQIFKLKQATHDEHYEYKLYKILMNSLYGCFYEKAPMKNGSRYAGKLFNPIYATEITADTRINLVKTSMPYINDVVAHATDSILFKGDPEITTSDKLGGWSLQASGKAIVLRSGFYQIDKIFKKRGIKKAVNISSPYGQFKNIFDFIKKYPDLTVYPIVSNRPLTFIECLIHHKKHDLTDINQFTDMEYKIDINKDHKRVWNSEFSRGIELFDYEIDSQPLTFEEIPA